MSQPIETGGDTRGSSAPRPLSRGIIVALIGPDGVGKSSQTARLTSLFRQDFKATAMYLGSGDGGWKLRRMAKRQFRNLRGRLRRPRSAAKTPAADKEYGTNHSVFTALSGLLAAIERSVSIRRAMRLARSGSIVICDRWPQNLQPGFFDGPLRLSPDAPWPVRAMARLEQGLYRRMEAFKPDLTIHLVSDFATSNARKPGDRTRSDFDQRLALMQEMREVDPTIITVDASRDFDDVTRDLRNCISRLIEPRSGPIL